MSNTGKTHFKTGHTPWNKGTRGLMGSSVGRKKGGIPWNKGRKMPQITGSRHHNFGKHFVFTDEHREKLSDAKRKERNPKWVSDRKQLVMSEKKHLDGRYREWMFSVKRRDSWKCKINNGDCNGRLESHHILNWKDYPELRYEIKNGITLCHAHHPRGREDEAKLSPFFQEIVTKVK